MAKVRFYLLDITYKETANSPVVWMFGRTQKGERICAIDTEFKPYFYVIPKKGKDIKGKISKVFAEKKEERYEVTKVEELSKRYLGVETTVLKVYVNLPKGVPYIRDVVKDWDEVKRCNEYDIKFERRYLIDKGITPFTLIEVEGETATEKARAPVIQIESITQVSDDTLPDPKVLSIDIETYNKGKGVNPEEDPIIMIGFYGKGFQKVITWKTFKTDEKYIEFVKSEIELLERTKQIIEKYEPDIITGYYSDGFDFPYIDQRAKKYKINMDIGVDYSPLQIKGQKQIQASITGIVHLDAFKMVLRMIGRGGDLESLGLSDVAEKLIGERKLDVDINSIAEIWDNKPEKIEEFCKYNLHDARITYKLFMKLLPNVIELVKIVGLAPFDIPRMGYSQLVEWYIIRQAPNFNEITLERPHYNEVKKRRMQTFPGAFVYEPTPGLYKDLAVFDFRSLYPTIIAAHNISPGTLNCECCIEKEIAPTVEDKYWFCTQRKGFIPTIIEDLITRRMRIKEMTKDKEDPMLKAREQSLKLLANSFYGYLGFFNARWYSIESARSVTGWGRYHIKQVIDTAEKEGFKVIYGDTDSVFLNLGDKKTEDAVKFVDKINAKLPGVMELEFEGYYPSGLFVSTKSGEGGAKKKYALLNQKGLIEIKGFETVRRNWSKIAKTMQKRVLEIVLKDSDVDAAAKYVSSVVDALKKHEIEVSDVIITTKLTKEIDEYTSIGPHVAAAQIMQNKGMDVAAGSLVKFVVCKGEGKIRDKVKLPESISKQDYDPEYYINNQILPSVDKIFEALGYNPEDLAKKGSQSKLESFFG